MAMPCSPGLSPQSVWMVFSAPEITTVSKPKRNPASAEVSDQKKMRAFISGTGRQTSDLRPQTLDLGPTDSCRDSEVRGLKFEGATLMSPADIPSRASRGCRHP